MEVCIYVYTCMYTYMYMYMYMYMYIVFLFVEFCKVTIAPQITAKQSSTALRLLEFIRIKNEWPAMIVVQNERFINDTRAVECFLIGSAV